MGILESTLGHGRIHEALLNALIQGRLPSQFLFVGPEGIGKKRFAWGIAEVLLCLRPPEVGKACGNCSSCVKIRTGFHESVLLIEPEKNLIKLERAKEIQDFLSLAQVGGARIIIVDEAHSLNAQASNSLLKIFEEPPPNTYFFFLTHRWAQVLPTIRSRSTRVAFLPLSSQDLNYWAEGDQNLIHLSRGSVKELLNQKDEDRKKIREEAFLIFQKFFADKEFFILGDWRETIKDKDKIMSFTRYWLLCLRDYFNYKYQGSLSKAPSYISVLSQYSEEQIWDLWESGLSLEAGLLGHRDSVLLIEEWLIPILV